MHIDKTAAPIRAFQRELEESISAFGSRQFYSTHTGDIMASAVTDTFVDSKARKEYELRDGSKLFLAGTLVLTLKRAYTAGDNKIELSDEEKKEGGFRHDSLLRSGGQVRRDAVTHADSTWRYQLIMC